MFLYLRKNLKFSFIGIFYGSVDRDTNLEERSLSDLVKRKGFALKRIYDDF